MDKEKLEAVSGILNVDASNVVNFKSKEVLKKIIYPVVQTCIYLLSSLLGLVFGHWENNQSSTYPYGPFMGTTRAYIWGPITLVGISSGNLILTLKTRKRFGLDKISAFGAVLTNLALSLVSFFLLYKLIENNSQAGNISAVTLYGVHKREEVSKNST